MPMVVFYSVDSTDKILHFWTSVVSESERNTDEKPFVLFRFVLRRKQGSVFIPWYSIL